MREELILASKSPFRAQLLANAGIKAEICGADIDERAIEAEFLTARAGAAAADNSGAAAGGKTAPLLAAKLAEAKALAVSKRFKDAYIIGCDQILELEGEILHKVADEPAAKERLARLSGATHYLHTAFTVAQGGAARQAHIETAELTMRELTPAIIDDYLKRAEKSIYQTVGAYQIEGPGLRLFAAVKGDYWGIIGLPLVPLFAALRGLGAADI